MNVELIKSRNVKQLKLSVIGFARETCFSARLHTGSMKLAQKLLYSGSSNRKLLMPLSSSSTANRQMDTSGASGDSPSTTSLYASRVSPALLEEWDTLQNTLRQQIVECDTEPWQLRDDLKGLNRVAGVDISVPAKDHDAKECDAFAAVVICNFPSMEVIHEETEKIHLDVPYVPGYLAFREANAAVNLIQRIVTNHPEKIPDVLLIDGNGILHPHRCGLACHIGIQTATPAIGVAKNLHLIEGISINKQMAQGMKSLGDHILIQDSANKVMGLALKTATDTKNPMYISIGHKISLDTAKKVVLKCSKYRIPEPIRFADNISRELIRKTEKEKITVSHNIG